jgi:uncharacterized protein (UPF0248 family)
MIPILELLNKIKWDKREIPSGYKIGYLDKIQNKIIFIEYEKMSFEDGNKFNFSCRDDEGNLHEIPFHRIRQVKNKDKIIWERK